jgi:hypothetical protein
VAVEVDRVTLCRVVSNYVTVDLSEIKPYLFDFSTLVDVMKLIMAEANLSLTHLSSYHIFLLPLGPYHASIHGQFVRSVDLYYLSTPSHTFTSLFIIVFGALFTFRVPDVIGAFSRAGSTSRLLFRVRAFFFSLVVQRNSSESACIPEVGRITSHQVVHFHIVKCSICVLVFLSLVFYMLLLFEAVTILEEFVIHLIFNEAVKDSAAKNKITFGDFIASAAHGLKVNHDRLRRLYPV